jgi:hypothetical protein
MSTLELTEEEEFSYEQATVITVDDLQDEGEASFVAEVERGSIPPDNTAAESKVLDPSSGDVGVDDPFRKRKSHKSKSATKERKSSKSKKDDLKTATTEVPPIPNVSPRFDEKKASSLSTPAPLPEASPRVAATTLPRSVVNFDTVDAQTISAPPPLVLPEGVTVERDSQPPPPPPPTRDPTPPPVTRHSYLDDGTVRDMTASTAATAAAATAVGTTGTATTAPPSLPVKRAGSSMKRAGTTTATPAPSAAVSASTNAAATTAAAAPTSVAISTASRNTLVVTAPVDTMSRTQPTTIISPRAAAATAATTSAATAAAAAAPTKSVAVERRDKGKDQDDADDDVDDDADDVDDDDDDDDESDGSDTGDDGPQETADDAVAFANESRGLSLDTIDSDDVVRYLRTSVVPLLELYEDVVQLVLGCRYDRRHNVARLSQSFTCRHKQSFVPTTKRSESEAPIERTEVRTCLRTCAW